MIKQLIISWAFAALMRWTLRQRHNKLTRSRIYCNETYPGIKYPGTELRTNHSTILYRIV